MIPRHIVIFVVIVSFWFVVGHTKEPSPGVGSDHMRMFAEEQHDGIVSRQMSASLPPHCCCYEVPRIISSGYCLLDNLDKDGSRTGCCRVSNCLPFSNVRLNFGE